MRRAARMDAEHIGLNAGELVRAGHAVERLDPMYGRFVAKMRRVG